MIGNKHVYKYLMKQTFYDNRLIINKMWDLVVQSVVLKMVQISKTVCLLIFEIFYIFVILSHLKVNLAKQEIF